MKQHYFRVDYEVGPCRGIFHEYYEVNMTEEELAEAFHAAHPQRRILQIINGEMDIYDTDCLPCEEPTPTEKQFRQMVEQLVKEQGSQEKAARALGVSGPFLSDYRKGRRALGTKIPAYFGFERQVMYVRLAKQEPMP